MTHKKEQQIKIEGEFKPTVDCLCATRRRFVFIHKGKVVFSKPKDELIEQYGVIKCGAAQFDALDKSDIITYRKMDYEWQILVSERDKIQKKYPKALIVPAAIDEIMLLYVKGER